MVEALAMLATREMLEMLATLSMPDTLATTLDARDD